MKITKIPLNKLAIQSFVTNGGTLSHQTVKGGTSNATSLTSGQTISLTGDPTTGTSDPGDTNMLRCGCIPPLNTIPQTHFPH